MADDVKIPEDQELESSAAEVEEESAKYTFPAIEIPEEDKPEEEPTT